jgi:hypothetical protein
VVDPGISKRKGAVEARGFKGCLKAPGGSRQSRDQWGSGGEAWRILTSKGCFFFQFKILMTYKLFLMISKRGAHNRCNEVFWTGLKIDPGGHFSTLNIETRHIIIRTPTVYSIKSLNFIPGFTLLFVYFAFDSLCHKIHSPQLGLVFWIDEN